MEPARKKKGRPPANKPAEKPSPSVKFTGEVDRLLTIHSKKLKISKTKYANAAVAYFAETGLNPTKERPHGLANVSSKVAQETLAVKELNVEIGNRLISIIRGWEKPSTAFCSSKPGP